MARGKRRDAKPPTRGGSSERVGEDIRMKASELLLRELRDPRLAGMHFTRVEVTRDLSHARLFYRMTPGGATVADAARCVPHAATFLRRELARTLNLRNVPEIELLHDEAPDDAARMDELLAQIAEERASRPLPVDADERPRPLDADEEVGPNASE